MKRIIQIILIIINVLAASGLLAAYCCCRISPETVWWLGFFGLAYVPLLAINVCCMIFWLLGKRKRYALLSAAVILSGWGFTMRYVQFFGRELPESEKDGSIKTISFNVHMFHQKDTRQEDGSMLNIFDFFNRSGADVICMQEFSASTGSAVRPEDVSRRLNMPDYHVELTGNAAGIATYSRFPIANRKLIYSDKTTNACMYTDLLINGDTIRVFNIHLKSIGFGIRQRNLLNHVIKTEYDNADVKTIRGIIRQMAEASLRRSKQVKAVEKHILESPYPVILCGDFNDPPVSYSYQQIRGKLKDAFMESGRGMSTTYDVGQLSKQRIDYILHSPSLTAYGYESPRVRLSDHYPVMCRLVRRK
ncbi:MAG: endonuclease/exonuclease/phosphatase family protein [Bacteroidales bacterium]|jgi:endonuclease/exonuclease/phosphatase family metal-dependent hydrolase|nr:endonuclease/exonuclease/phosphatase family protein [Bacteroidales bacterium]